MRIGLLLEGGGMRGLYTAGVLDVFMENDIKINGIVGVSAGALFGMNYKSKQIGRVLRYNKKYARDKNYMGLHSLITTGNIMNEDFCFNRIVNELDPVDFETFKNSEVDFYAVVTNVETGKAEYIKIEDLKDKDSVEILRASGSMPFVSKTVIVNSKVYLDGGIADSIPIDKIMSMNFDKIIVVLTRPLEYRKKRKNKILTQVYYRKYPNFVETINNRYKRYNEELDKILELEKAGKIFVIRPSKLVNIKRVEKDINKIQEMYDLGRSDTVNLLDKMSDYISNATMG